jgi:hypothetical protein
MNATETKTSHQAALQPTVVLTEEQIQFFHDNGFLAIDAITTPAEVEIMKAAYDRIFEQQAGRAEGNQFDLAGTDEDGKAASLPQILGPSKYAPELANTAGAGQCAGNLSATVGRRSEVSRRPRDFEARA